MTNIILITNGARPRLLAQTLRTLYANTPREQFSLTIVADGPIRQKIHIAAGAADGYEMICVENCNIVGRLKNLGAYWSGRTFGRGDYICFIDDDMALFPEWLSCMTMVYPSMTAFGGSILGACRHPFHGVNLERVTGRFGWQQTDAVAGYCHFMNRSSWAAYGPYDAHAKGTGQSEDFSICRKIVDDGGRVGYIHTPVMSHCGITNSEGKPAIGSEQIIRVPGYIYE